MNKLIHCDLGHRFAHFKMSKCVICYRVRLRHIYWPLDVCPQVHLAGRTACPAGSVRSWSFWVAVPSGLFRSSAASPVWLDWTRGTTGTPSSSHERNGHLSRPGVTRHTRSRVSSSVYWNTLAVTVHGTSQPFFFTWMAACGASVLVHWELLLTFLNTFSV